MGWTRTESVDDVSDRCTSLKAPRVRMIKRLIWLGYMTHYNKHTTIPEIRLQIQRRINLAQRIPLLPYVFRQ